MPTRNERYRAKRRQLLPGYPILRKLTSPDDVREYFAGDELTCLLCGRSMRHLARHLRRIHRLSVDQYKRRYGLPWGRGLITEGQREKLAAILASQPRRPLPIPTSSTHERRPLQPFERTLALKSLEQATPKRPNSRGAHERFLDRLRHGETVRNVARSPDMPSLAAHYRYRQSHPGYDRRVKQTLLAHPIPGRIRPKL